jgi:hypothetical protein
MIGPDLLGVLEGPKPTTLKIASVEWAIEGFPSFGDWSMSSLGLPPGPSRRD